MSDYKQAFFIVPSHILDLPDMQLAYLKVYETIFQFWNHKKTCFLSNAMIAERTGIKSESTVRNALAYFEKHGELLRMKKGLKRYLVQPTKAIVIETDEQLPVDKSVVNSINKFQGAPNSAGGRAQLGGQTAPNSAHNNKKLNIKNINKRSFNVNDQNKNTQETEQPTASVETVEQCMNKLPKHLRPKRYRNSTA